MLKRYIFGGILGLAGGLHHPEGQGVPSLLVADEEHHLLPVGAFVDFSGAEALALEDGDADVSVVRPGEGVNAGREVCLTAKEQLVDIHPEGLRHGGEEGDVGAGKLALPLGHGLGGDPQPVSQQLLGQPRGAAKGGDVLTQTGKIVFHGLGLPFRAR